MEPERITCPAQGCGRQIAVRYASCTDGNEARTRPHNKPDGSSCRRGYFTYRVEGGWVLAFWY